jgi:GTP cyclohydrolase IA
MYTNGNHIIQESNVLSSKNGAIMNGLNGHSEKKAPAVNITFDPKTAKINKIAWHFRQIMETMGMDLNDDSLEGTPLRVAKMYVNEIFSGLNPENKPSVTLFDNKFQYNQMLIEKNITVHSFCEHHFVPIIGKAHVAYISSGKVIGLSKLNRIVRHFSKKPQIQERLTEEIALELKKVLNTDDVAVFIEASHMCVLIRGVEDHGSTTITTSFSGKFLEESKRNEFLGLIR